MSCQVKSIQVKSSHVKSSQVKSSQVKSSQVKLSQVKSSQVKSSQVKSSRVRQSSNSHGLGQVASGGFPLSRDGSGHPDATRPDPFEATQAVKSPAAFDLSSHRVSEVKTIERK